MEVRGSILKSIDEFVSKNHSDKYTEWKSSLTDETKGYLENIGARKWYPLKDGVIDPTEKMCEMFYKDFKEGAWKSGRYSAEEGLTGIYKVFVIISSPAFMLKRTSRVLPTFYTPTSIELVNSTNKSMLLHVMELPDNHKLLEYRIAGWMEKALEICGCKDLEINLTKSLSKGDSVTEYDIKWK